MWRKPSPLRKWLESRSDPFMQFTIAISGFVALYVFMLAAFAGWVIIGHVPAILHTPLMSGSNFVHGIVVVGGLFAVLNGAGNAAGGFAVTQRMLAMFQVSGAKPKHAHAHPRAHHRKTR